MRQHFGQITVRHASCGGSGFSAEFGNTAKLRIAVSSGVTFTSQSGTLLTGVTAFSRRTHGSAGTFDIALPFTGTPGVECRGSAGGAYQIVSKFANTLGSIGRTTVTGGTGTVQGATVSSGDVTIDLTGPSNQQTTL